MKLSVFASILVISVISIISCKKNPVDQPDTAIQLPHKLISINWEHDFTYNSDNTISKIVKRPWYIVYGTVAKKDIDTIYISYNSDKTPSRVVFRRSVEPWTNAPLRAVRTAKFFEYSGGRLLKIYTKTIDTRESYEVYDSSYEKQMGPVTLNNITNIDSFVYNANGRFSEIFSFQLQNSYGSTPSGYLLEAIRYKKIEYMASNDSLPAKITAKGNKNMITDNSMFMTVLKYDTTAKNPIYSYAKYFPFTTGICIMPLSGYDEKGTLLWLSPYLLKTFTATDYSLAGILQRTYDATNKYDSVGKTFTSATYGVQGGGGFTFYY